MAVTDRDELWEVQCQLYIVETNHVHNISHSLAKPVGRRCRGRIQQLDGVSPACVPERSRTGGQGRKRRTRPKPL